MARRIHLFLPALAICILLTCTALFAAAVRYHYDELNRLTRVDYDDGRILIYSYDELGNRLTQVVDRAPNSPANPSISDGATNVVLDPYFSWTGGDPDGNAVTYDLYLDTNQQPATLFVHGLASPDYQGQGLNCNTTYYWSVTSTDQYGVISRSTVWHFTTGPCPVKNTQTNKTYPTLQAAYDEASDGDTILCQNVRLRENFVANKDISIGIVGGYDSNFGSNPNKTIMIGSPKFSNGTVSIGNFRIDQ